MKTTLEISTPLFERAKMHALKQGMTFRAVTELALKTFLDAQKSRPKRFKLRKASFKGKGLALGVNEGDWSSLRQKIYEGRGG